MLIECVYYLTVCLNLDISAHNDTEFAAECHNARNSFCDFLYHAVIQEITSN